MKNIFTLILILTTSTPLFSKDNNNFINDVIKKFNVDIGLNGYMQNFYPENFEDKYEDSYFYKLHIQGTTPKGVKIKYTHLDAHYGYWRYFENLNSNKFDKIQLSLDREIKNSRLKINLGHIDDFKFSQGLTFDSYYHYGIDIQLEMNNLMLSNTYFMSSIQLGDYYLTRLCYNQIIGLSFIYFHSLSERKQYLPGIDISLSIFEMPLKLYGEIRTSTIQDDQYNKDLSLENKLGYLAGLNFNIQKNDYNYLNIDISTRKYSQYFNQLIAGNDFYTFQNRSPEVRHAKHNNWLHYIEHYSDVTGLTYYMEFSKTLYNDFYFYGMLEYTKIDWTDSKISDDPAYYDASLNYIYDSQIKLSIGVTNKFIETCAQNEFMRLFTDTSKMNTRLRIDFSF